MNMTLRVALFPAAVETEHAFWENFAYMVSYQFDHDYPSSPIPSGSPGFSKSPSKKCDTFIVCCKLRELCY